MPVFSRDFNPFANIDIHVPKAHEDDVRRYSGRGEGKEADTDEAPFLRMVDAWFLAMCVGAREGAFLELPPNDLHKFHTGQVLQGDLARIEYLLLQAIAHTGDPYVVTDARRVVQIADAYAAGGMPYLVDLISAGHSSAATNLTMALLREIDDAVVGAG